MAYYKPSLKEAHKAFEDSLIKSNFEHCNSRLRAFGTHHKDADYLRLSRNIWWRLLNTAKKARYSGDVDRAYMAMRLIADNLKNLPLNNRQKRIVLGFVDKYQINTYFPTILQELRTPNVKDFAYEKPHRPYTEADYEKELQQEAKNYKKFLQSFPPKVDFLKRTQEVFNVYADMMQSCSNIIHFSEVYRYLQQNGKNVPYQSVMNFETGEADRGIPHNFDKEGLKQLVALLGNTLRGKNSGMPNKIFMNKFKALVLASVRKNKYSLKDVKSLAAVVRAQKKKASRILRPYFDEFVTDLQKEYQKKENLQIKGLNEWYAQKLTVKSVNLYALTDVYLDQLRKKLIGGQELEITRLNKEYQNKKAFLAEQFFAAQKIGHSKEGINAFYAGKRQEQQHSFAELCKFISQKYPRAEFRSEIIKNAQNGGLKQPLMQVISPHIHD